MLFMLLLSILIDESLPRVGSTPAIASVAANQVSDDDSVPLQEASAPELETETPAFTAEQLRQFETHVRPILDEHCLKCHGSTKQWASLRLDSRKAILKGGDSGPAAVAGEPNESLLIRAVRHDDENLKMPQDDKLTDAQIEILSSWVKSGLAFPAVSAASRRHRDPNHWAFVPPVEVAIPPVQNSAWPQSDLDRFVLARLEAEGLSPAPKADKQALIRRVTFDLTGLPPTPAEISAFLHDERPEAYPELIERLLSSPAYGERWGRHWLDIARYADSNGLDENVAHGNAWRYRDYVVRSFNADKPFDQFIREQLAGDQLEASSDELRNELLTATGFLSIGPKVLAEVNMPKMRMDIVDEQIDTVGRVFLGMTFGCARCHDHKFDPIDTADYYGLAGIFKSTRTMDTYTKVAKWHEHPLKSAEATQMQADYEAQVAAKKLAIDTTVRSADEALQASLPDGAVLPESKESQYPEETRTTLTKLREELSALEKAPPELPTSMGVTEDEIVDVAIHVRGNPSRLGDVVPRHVPAVMKGPEMPGFSGQHGGRRELAEWLVNDHHPLTSRVLVNRVWRWHFGRGLVASADNFGLLGEKPSHPELLDWLAKEFVHRNWSLKEMHRVILLSNTYQQSTLVSSEAATADPDNRLWSRFPVRRLAAEEIRDSLLFVSGQLDATMGGSLLKVKNRGYLFDHTSIDTTDYNSPRRSLYLPVIRNNVFEMFQLLDFPDPAVPTGDRATTTVAPQALMMMNSDFVMQAADALAGRVLTTDSTDSERVKEIYVTCLGREPSNEEISQDLQLIKDTLQTFSSDARSDKDRLIAAWSVACQVVLASSEFVYLQ
ncbi:MAG: PSD1 and planctomycete cytochrome C domain-containing protein [Planctomycetales bacterium]|nr:PSD1 and planctomycete cytochrome C domain-containing protein [Planctomycetales bacterium]